MSVRKYITEFGLGMRFSQVWLLQQGQLEELKNFDQLKNDPPHIYIIARQSKISIDPQLSYIDDSTISINFKIQDKNSHTVESFSFPNPSKDLKLQLDCQYPYTEFSIINKKGSNCLSGKSSIFLLHLLGLKKNSDLTLVETIRIDYLLNHLSFEVVYVGQAYGKEGSRTALDRLPNHGTLQKIYFESNQKHPDKDVWIILCSFAKSVITTINPTKERYGVSLEENDKHLYNVANTVMNDEAGITDGQSINFTEAALIKYFQPEYNIIFKDNFPSPSHSTYSECYELDINSLIIELSTIFDIPSIGEVQFKLHSSKVEADFEHLIHFDLHSREKRESMFDFS